MEDNTAILVQARSGSTRLPGKMVLPFYNQETLLDIVIRNLSASFDKKYIIIATTEKKSDDEIVAAALKHGVNYFRGNELNVLNRFINAAEKFKVKNIVRICADNPFIQASFINTLLETQKDTPSEYISFETADSTPSIKTHFGFFSELVTLNALKKISSLTSEPIFFEHVTNFIYANPDKFKIKFLQMPKEIRERNDIRLTVDSQNDFDICFKLYNELIQKNLPASMPNILSVIDNNDEYLKIMKHEIKLQKK